MGVDLTPLKNAVARLGEAHALYEKDTSNAIVRDAMIQRFEFSYDLASKMLRRVIANRSDTPSDVDRMSFPTLMRTAFEQGLVDQTWPTWLDFRGKRNITSHAYNEDKAIEVAQAVPHFLDVVQELSRRLSAAVDG